MFPAFQTYLISAGLPPIASHSNHLNCRTRRRLTYSKIHSLDTCAWPSNSMHQLPRFPSDPFYCPSEAARAREGQQYVTYLPRITRVTRLLRRIPCQWRLRPALLQRLRPLSYSLAPRRQIPRLGRRGRKKDGDQEGEWDHEWIVMDLCNDNGTCFAFILEMVPSRTDYDLTICSMFIRSAGVWEQQLSPSFALNLLFNFAMANGLLFIPDSCVLSFHYNLPRPLSSLPTPVEILNRDSNTSPSSPSPTTPFSPSYSHAVIVSPCTNTIISPFDS